MKYEAGSMKYYNWVLEQARRYVEMRALNIDFLGGENSRLYGAGAFDSMQLVDFIMFIEDAFFEEYGKRILLADGEAFSQRRSPYLNLGSFAAFLLQKADA
jgi:hypothetical protein